MTYQQTLTYLFEQLPMYHRIGAAAFKKDLTNTIALCEHIGNPQTTFKTVHVGGTNGKGSTSHLLAAALQAASYKVGLYTSPHYKDFRERIKINGKLMEKKYVVDFVEKNKPIFAQIEPSFFEMTVAMAFAYFADNQVDVSIIEVGLGGRLDSTNIITPELSVITNISFDHVNMLGNTLSLIAFEKAGIIKKNIPIVIGETQAESAPIFIEKAEKEAAPIFFADKNYDVKAKNEQGLYDVFHNNQLIYSDLRTSLFGAYQVKNLVTFFQSIEILKKKGFSIEEKHIRAAFEDLYATVGFVGRWQQLGTQPLIIADSGHNEAGVLEAIAQLNTLTFKRLHLVTGFVNDKDVQKILSLYPKKAIYYFSKANIPRGLDATLLQQSAAEIGLKGRAYSSVKNAFRAAKRNADKEDMVLVLGSIFVVAEVI